MMTSSAVNAIYDEEVVTCLIGGVGEGTYLHLKVGSIFRTRWQNQFNVHGEIPLQFTFQPSFVLLIVAGFFG